MMQDDGQSSRGRRDRLENTPRLSDDRLYQCLASRERRRLLYVLLVEEESTVDHLATVLVGWELESSTMATQDDRERLLVRLVHTHLPVLENAGFVTHDRERDTVRLEPIADTVRELVSRSVETERPST